MLACDVGGWRRATARAVHWPGGGAEPLTLCPSRASRHGRPHAVPADHNSMLQRCMTSRLVRSTNDSVRSAAGAGALHDRFHLERLLVECVRHNDMQRHRPTRAGLRALGCDLFSESQREDKGRARPHAAEHAQATEGGAIKLINMATVVDARPPPHQSQRQQAEREKTMHMMVSHYHETKVKEHMRILARHKIIEDRKEFLERMNTVRSPRETRFEVLASVTRVYL
ncbi:hypothetical protein LSTR_LSTR016574 [Laodelphax striatellus]|uniref:Uncharacterized protein n=1 Tax=Laodelphax striatellus TaxID=195883 RepID=A0A482X1L0_LAOST|nr:hypothetical protein LSTR_LSTR016574 [Laodelphax striatellus]